MIPYILCFLITTLFAYGAEKCFRNKNNKIGILCLIIVITILSVFAGLRSPDLGFDTQYYVTPLIKRINAINFNYSKLIDTTNLELGYVTYGFILLKIFNNINFLEFGLNLIVNIFVIVYAYSKREQVSLSRFILVYELTLYIMSFNIVRQCISTAIVIFSMKFLEKKKYFTTAFLFIIAFLFHNSAFIAIITYVLFVILQSKKIRKKDKSIISILVFLMICFGCMFYDKIIVSLYQASIIPYKYYNYLNLEQYNVQKLNFKFVDILIKVIWLGLGAKFFSIKSVSDDEKNELRPYYLFLLIDFVLTILSAKITNITRISYYFYYLSICMLLPNYVKIFKNNKLNQTIGWYFIVLILIIFLIWKLPVSNAYNIYPYISNLY